MYQLLALLTGVTLAVMVSVNGNLTAAYSVFVAAAIVHLVGSLFAPVSYTHLRPAFFAPLPAPAAAAECAEKGRGRCNGRGIQASY